MNIWRFSGQVRKIRVVMLVFLLGLFGSFHLSIAQDGNDASSTLIDASSNNFPPMNVLDKDGNLTGFGCDLSDAVMKAVGRQVTHIHSPHWVQVLEWLDSGKADFIHDTGYTKDRDKFLDYSDPIIEMPEVIFVRPDQYDVTDIDSLKGKTVACVKKHITDLHLQKFPEINRHVVKTPIEGLYELIAGKVDAFIYPKQIVLYLAQKLRLGDKIKIAGEPLRILTWSMVVKEGNKKVLDLLNQGIAKVRESGEYDRIYDKWWGMKILAGYSKRELYVIAAVTSGGSLLIALAIALLLFNRRLSKGKKELKVEIVERKRAEEALQKHQEHLEELVEKRTISLQKKIVEHKLTEDKLRQSEEKLRSLVGNIPGVSYRCRCDEQWTMEFISDEVKNLTGYPASDFLQNVVRSWASIMHPEGKEASDEYALEKINRKEPYTLEYRIIGADGNIRWCYEKGQGVFDEQGKLCFLDGVIVDRTDHKQAEEALWESEEQYRTLMDNLPVAVYRNRPGPEGQFLMANPAFCKMFGFKNEEEVKKMTSADLYANPKERKQYSDNLIEKGVVENDERTLLKIDGTPVHTSITSRVVYGKDGEVSHFDSIMLDITEKQRLEDQLQQATKMEAIATLAGGVAHEFNNALMGIMGNIELLKMNFSEDGGIDKHLESMKSAGHRMSRLTAQLLAYAEGGKYQPKDLKLDNFVIETLSILQHDFSPEVRVEIHFQKDISYIRSDYAQMQMVLSAILANSNEAIEDEGLIRIAAENKDLDEDFTKQHPGLKPGPYVCLTIEDDGEGMDEETRSGIFEPFFTTKFQGRGMGMAAVHGIVRNHDGWISVDSELGRGTTVQIYLPAIEVEIKKPRKAKAEVSTGSGTILMIEDEDVVIEVTQMMLEMLGYRVMVAKTGKDAIHIAETFDGQIDLALLDIKLPDIDGRNLYPLIMKARSNMKVIVFSGYSIDGPAREILNAGAQDFIQKPFSIATLSEKLKEVFEGK